MAARCDIALVLYPLAPCAVIIQWRTVGMQTSSSALPINYCNQIDNYTACSGRFHQREKDPTNNLFLVYGALGEDQDE